MDTKYFQLLLPTADHSWTGVTTLLAAGTGLAFSNACYVGADGKMELADADGEATMPVVALCCQTIAEDAEGEFLLFGFIRDNSWSWTPGGLVYPSTTIGVLNQTRPSGSGNQVQVVGVAFTEKVIFFCPSLELVEVA
jgi:hypothetical protein